MPFVRKIPQLIYSEKKSLYENINFQHYAKTISLPVCSETT